MVSTDPDVGIAFALVFGAGAATALGAAVVFFPALVKLASRRVLASALGLSAGVMTYVSFVEIFQKSLGSFGDAGFSEEDAYLYATLCFFGGVVVMLFVDFAVKAISGGHHHHGSDDHDKQTANKNVAEAEDEHDAEDSLHPGPVCCSSDPVGDLEKITSIANAMDKENVEDSASSNDYVAGKAVETSSSTPNKEGEAFEDKESAVAKRQESQKLIKMGINTAIAIGLHNFPEGLATFVAALSDPRVGAVLAMAIGIHNIPEGLCVALPIYYATGNRWKAFMWALISGASEPLAALLGWAVLANSFSDQLYAILFGLVAGMMVIISVRELMPTAHRYDPEDTVVTFSFIGGMAIMALSLVLFAL